ncbi:hypothetical protein V6N13_009906 [Hibiscus sabdariffa]
MVVVAAIVATAVLNQIAAILKDEAMEEMKKTRSLETEVKNLETYLIAIQSTLEDAEQRQMVDGAMGLYLQDLETVSYEIEDVLEEWERRRPVSMIDEVMSFFFGSDIADRIKTICTRLHAFEMKNKSSLGNSEIKSPSNKETTCYGDEVIGRDEIKTKIVSDLIDENDEQGTRTISIVGMGGIGKTALAQLIYRDPQLVYKDIEQKQKRFDRMIWITKKIEENTIFLILDDLWSINDNEGWEQLQAVLKQAKTGSKILVTTRNLCVARCMSIYSDFIYHLSVLPELDSWSMLDQFAFEGKDKLSDGERQTLIEISKKCKGLPLVVKGLVNFLQSKPLEWRSLQNKELLQIKDVWELVMPSLLLSYFDLPLEIKQCFMYCAIFPKGHMIRRDNLINHWMAHNYLYGTNGDMEDIGRDFFNGLAFRCLFQDFKKEGDRDCTMHDFMREGDGVVVQCKMHDIMHDLVQYLTGKNFATIDLDGLGLSDPLLSSDGARHLTIILPSSVTRELILSDRLRLCNVSKLRGLVIFSSEGNRVVQADDLLQLFKKNELLRVLDLGWDDSSDLCQKILRKKDKWKYLKHLNLFGCKTIQELPDIICKLHDLLSLDLRGCFGVGSYPKGIRGLTSLRTLTDIIARVGRNNPREFCLGDLENLNNLRGNLRLKLIGNAIDVQEVDKAKLQNKTRLRDIKIYLDGGIDLAAATIALNRHPSTSVQDMITWEVWSSPPASMLLATMKMLGFR